MFVHFKLILFAFGAVTPVHYCSEENMKSLLNSVVYAMVMSMLHISIGYAETSGVTAIHKAPAFYSANQLITVTTDIICDYTLTALGMSVTLPTDWTFERTSGANVPEITKVENNIISFAWQDNMFPKNYTFSYDITAPSYAKSDQVIRAKVLYREGASEEKEILVLPYALLIQADVDQDGDDYPNSQDAFPDDPNEWLDTDGDNIGDNADTDDDGDGMLDAWEIAHGFDPLENNSNDDFDNDGIINSEEIENGTPVYNFRPDIPILISPIGQETQLTPTLKTEPFADANETDTHYATEWQISKQSSFDVLIYKQYTTNNLLELEIPTFLLEPDQTYYWRASHYDNYIESSLSEIAQFQTVTQNNYDNGVPIDQKVPDDVDLDKDGTYDNLQDSIKSLSSIVGDVQIGMRSESPDQYTVAMASSIDPEQRIDETFNRPARLPFGMLAFKLNVANPGDIAIVTVHYSSPLPENTLWYTYDSLNGWQSYMPQLSTNRTIVTLILKDGGKGDADGVANGIIVDPSGPGIPDSESSDSISIPELVNDVDNGSCFINSLLVK